MVGAAPPLSRFDRALISARTGLEGVLFVMAKEGKEDDATHPAWSALAMALDVGQLFTFPLYSGSAFPWCVGAAASSVAAPPPL